MARDKIIFLSAKNPFSTKDWSGIPFFLYQALSAVYDIEYVPLPKFASTRLAGYYLSKLFRLIFRTKYVFDYGLIIALLNGIVGTARLKNKRAKFIFSPAGLPEIAFIKTSIPVVSYGDCSTLQMIDYYPALTGVCRLSKAEIRFVEKQALKKIRFAFFSSQWASDFVSANFGVPTITIPFGANLSLDNTMNEKQAKKAKCSLLFVGVDWTRKGADAVLKIHRELLAKEIPSRLTMVGSVFPDHVEKPPHTVILENLDKDSQAGREIFKQLFYDADFLLLPTLADCTPIVVAEAYAFGVPVLASDTGGLPSMVLDDVTGHLFEKNDPVAYVRYIIQLFQSADRYDQMSRNCLSYSRSTFNWNSWALTLSRHCDSGMV